MRSHLERPAHLGLVSELASGNRVRTDVCDAGMYANTNEQAAGMYTG